jgi:hypothetical protein
MITLFLEEGEDVLPGLMSSNLIIIVPDNFRARGLFIDQEKKIENVCGRLKLFNLKRKNLNAPNVRA